MRGIFPVKAGALRDWCKAIGRLLGAIARLSPDYRPIIAAILTDSKQK